MYRSFIRAFELGRNRYIFVNVKCGHSRNLINDREAGISFTALCFCLVIGGFRVRLKCLLHSLRLGDWQNTVHMTMRETINPLKVIFGHVKKLYSEKV